MTVECWVHGDAETGLTATSTYWDRITYQGVTGYIADAWVDRYRGHGRPLPQRLSAWRHYLPASIEGRDVLSAVAVAVLIQNRPTTTSLPSPGFPVA